MPTQVLQGIGEVEINPRAQRAFAVLQWASMPLVMAGGGIVLGGAIFHVRRTMEAPVSGSHYTTVLLLTIIGLALLGAGALLQATARSLPGRYFLPGDWAAVMATEQRRGRPGFALAAARRLVRYAPQNLTDRRLHLQAHLLLAEHEPASWSRALALVDDLLREGVNDVETRLDRAVVLEKLGRFDEARETCGAVLREGRTPPARAYLIQASCQAAVQQWDEAIATLEQSKPVLSRYPDAPHLREEVEEKIRYFRDRAAADAGGQPGSPPAEYSPAAFLDRPRLLLDEMAALKDGDEQLRRVIAAAAGKDTAAVLRAVELSADGEARRRVARAALHSTVLSASRTAIVLGAIGFLVATPFASLTGQTFHAWSIGELGAFMDSDAGLSGLLAFLAGPLSLLFLTAHAAALASERTYRKPLERLGGMSRTVQFHRIAAWAIALSGTLWVLLAGARASSS